MTFTSLNSITMLPIVRIVLLTICLYSGSANSFCGFYVAKADANLFNESSKVAIARNGKRTVITMVNDYHGDLKDFAMVIPTPGILKREQIHVTSNAIMKHLDDYTAPRLVEYFDENPCNRFMIQKMDARMSANGMAATQAESSSALGVQIEARYEVGEYDILMLSASQSDGLIRWLNENNYKIPKGANEVVSGYISAGMKFFIAKINLERKARSGGGFLNPLQLAFESKHFMLPIRLGMLNAKDQQDLIIYMLTKEGRVETVNYRTIKIPSDENLPVFIKDSFGEFYQDMFSTVVKREGNRGVFLEYAWNMNWCDPCAADPLSTDELRELGVFWLKPVQTRPIPQGNVKPQVRNRSFAPPRAANVYVTRLHVRYDKHHFHEDLKFQETNNRMNFQGRYIMRHVYKGEANCPQAKQYFESLPDRFEREAQTLAHLTGWDIEEIRVKNIPPKTGYENGAIPEDPWWRDIWPDSVSNR